MYSTKNWKQIPKSLFYTSEVWADLGSPSCWESWNINLLSDRFLFTEHSQQLWNWGFCLPVLNHFNVQTNRWPTRQKIMLFHQNVDTIVVKYFQRRRKWVRQDMPTSCSLFFFQHSANGSLKLLTHVIEPPRTIRNLSINLLTKREDLLWILKTCHVGHRHLQWLDFRFLKLHTRGSQILPQT